MTMGADGRPPDAALLELDRLHVELPIEGEQRPVIHEVTLSIARGEAVGLVGESGAGKSMTSRAVIRLLPSGAVVDRQGAVRRRRTSRPWAVRRCAAFAPRTWR